MGFKKILKKVRSTNKAVGEEIPNQQIAVSNFLNKKRLLAILATFFVLIYILNILGWTAFLVKKGHYTLAQLPIDKACVLAINPLKAKITLKEIILAAGLSPIIVFYVALKATGGIRDGKGGAIAYGQKGDSRFTSEREIKQQYKAIPEKTDQYPGHGGLPISHIKDKYYIDDEPVHNIIVGTSRSRKTVQTIIPMIDNLSRAQEKSSLVVNDPKKELYTASADILRKRGYDVYLLNLSEPMNSMSYNPLALATEKWEEGQTGTAMQMINSISYRLNHKENGGANDWVYRGALSGDNALISEMIRFCLNPKNFSDNKPHPEKATMNNLVQLATQLTGVKFYEEIDENVEEHLVIDNYFEALPQESYAKQQYTIISSNPERSRSSIYSQMLQGLDLFQLPGNAALTSISSINLRSVGFPKYIKCKFPTALEDKKITVRFRKKIENGKSKIISEYPVRVGNNGYVDYNFDVKLTSGDLIEICYAETNQVEHTLLSIILNDSQSKQNDHFAKTKVLHDDLGISKVKLFYSDKPTAIFVSAPDYDQSNNAIYPIFIDQLYGELARQCSNVAGGKTIYRVQYLWDEFGNMPPINNMDGIMSVAAGRNMLFTLAIQSYQQLYSIYGNSKGAIIKDNGQNQKLLKCNDMKTNDDFSKAAGQKTIEANSANSSNSRTGQSTSYGTHAEGVPLITSSRLSQMLAGEELNLRSVHRFANNGDRVRPYPIFNHGKTQMPAAFTILEEFDTKKDPNMVEVECLHKHINQQTFKINVADFLRGTASDLAVEAYEQSVKKEAKIPVSGINSVNEKIDKDSEMNFFDDIDAFDDKEIFERILDEEMSPEQEEKRINSNFVKLVMDYKGKGIDVSLADKILQAFDNQDIVKLKSAVNSIDDDLVRETLEQELERGD